VKIDDLLNGPQINTCDEVEEIAQSLADFIREVIIKRGIQVRLAIHMLKGLGELMGIDWLTVNPPEPVTLAMIRAAKNLIAQFPCQSAQCEHRRGTEGRGTEVTTQKIFKVETRGNEIYIQAPDEDHARLQLFEFTRRIPEQLPTWSEVDALPEGQEFL
jgi:hypothetical protein